MMKSKLALFVVALMALSLFVGCPKATDSTDSKAELKAAVNDFAKEVIKCSAYNSFITKLSETIAPKWDRLNNVFDKLSAKGSVTDPQSWAFTYLETAFNNVRNAADDIEFGVTKAHFMKELKKFNEAG